MKNRKLDLKVGQEVAIADIGDRIRSLKNSEGVSLGNIEKWTKLGVVTKVGRKYVTAKVGGWELRYDKECNYREKYDCGSNSRLYLSLDEIREEWEASSLYNSISDSFVKYNYENKCELTLDQLKRIKAIIEED